MKRDENFVSRLEVGDHFKNDEGETCRVNSVSRDGSIDAATVRDNYLRMYNRDGSGKTPVSRGIKTD